MKKLIFFLLIFDIISSALYSQDESITIDSSYIAGFNTLSNKNLVGYKISFNKFIIKTRQIKGTPQLYIQTSGANKSRKDKGYMSTVLNFNLDSFFIQWQIDYRPLSINYYLYKNSIIKADNLSNTFYDINTGKELWSNKTNIFYIDQKSNIAIGYRHFNTGLDYHTIQGYNVNTGEKLWEKVIKGENYSRDIIALNDDTLLIQSGGIHVLDLKTGAGWDCNAKTIFDKKDSTIGMYDNVVFYKNPITDRITGSDIGKVKLYDPNILTDIQSNVLIENNNIYYASNSRLYKYNFNGNKVWDTILNKDNFSMSKLITNNNYLYLLHYGFSISSNNIKKTGTPTMSIFNKLTGEKISEEVIEMENQNVILQAKKSNDTLLLLTNTELFSYSLASNNFISKEVFELDSNNYFEYIDTSNYYYVDSNGFKKITASQLGNIFVHASNAIYEMNNTFENVNKYSIENIMRKRYSTDNLMFLIFNKKYIVLTNNLKQVGVIDTDKPLYFNNKYLFYTISDAIIKVPLNNFN